LLLTDSKLVELKEVLLGKLIFLLELGLTLISGRKLSPVFISGSGDFRLESIYFSGT